MHLAIIPSESSRRPETACPIDLIIEGIIRHALKFAAAAGLVACYGNDMRNCRDRLAALNFFQRPCNNLHPPITLCLGMVWKERRL